MSNILPPVCQAALNAELPDLSSLSGESPSGCMEPLDLSGQVNISYQWLESAPIPFLPYRLTSLVEESIEFIGNLDQEGRAEQAGFPYGPLRLALGYELTGTEHLLISRQLDSVRSILSHISAVFSSYTGEIASWLALWGQNLKKGSVEFEQRQALQAAVSRDGFSYLAMAHWSQVAEGLAPVDHGADFPAAELAMSQLLRRYDLQAWDLWPLLQRSAITGQNAPLPGVSALGQLNLKLFLGDSGLNQLFQDFLARCWRDVAQPYSWGALELLVHALLAAATHQDDASAGWQSPLLRSSEGLAAIVQPLIEQIAGLAELLVKTQLSRQETIYTQIPAIIQWQPPPKYRRRLEHLSARLCPPESHQGDPLWPCNRALLPDFQCDIASGSVHFNCVDFSIPGSTPLPWLRTYSSSLLKDTGMGTGWAWYGSELLNVYWDHVVWETVDATIVYFDLPEIGKCSTNEALGATLYRDFQSVFRVIIAGVYSRLFSGRNTVVINEHELNNRNQHEAIQLSAVIAKSGYRIDFNYHNHRLCELATSEGLTYRIRYDAGRVIALDDLCQQASQLRTVVKYSYRNAMLAEAIANNGCAEFYGYDQKLLNRRHDQSGHIWNYHWLLEASNRQETSEAKLLESVTFDDKKIKIAYPKKDRRRVAFITEDAQKAFGWVYVLNEQQQVISCQADIDSTVGAAPLGVLFEYDERGFLINKSHENGLRFDYRYDVFGNLTACLDSNGGGYTLVYDECNLPIEFHDSVGQSWLIERNKDTTINRIENPDGSIQSAPVCDKAPVIGEAVVGEGGNVTRGYQNSFEEECFNSISANRVSFLKGSERNKIDDPSQIRFRPDFITGDEHYNSFGQIVKLTLGPGENASECVYQYDSKGRLYEAHNNAGLVTLDYNFRDQVISDCFNGQKVDIQFNHQGKKIGLSVQGFYNLDYHYDDLGRLSVVKYNGVAIIVAGTELVRCGEMEYPLSSGFLGVDFLSSDQDCKNTRVFPSFYSRTHSYENMINDLQESVEHKKFHHFEKYHCDGFGRPVVRRHKGTAAASLVADFIWYEKNLVRQQADLTVMDFIYHPITGRMLAAVCENKVIFYRYNNTNEIVEIRDWEGKVVWVKASGNPCQYEPEILFDC